MRINLTIGVGLNQNVVVRVVLVGANRFALGGSRVTLQRLAIENVVLITRNVAVGIGLRG